MSDKGVLILKWPLQRRNFFSSSQLLKEVSMGLTLSCKTGTKSVVRSLKNCKLKPFLVLK